MTDYRQTTLFEPQTLDATICAIEQRGWYLLSSADDVTTWERRGVERVLATGDLAAWLAAGCPEQAEPDVLAVEAAIRDNAPITRRKLKALLAKSFDVSGLAETLAELLSDGYIEETPNGLVEVDRI